MIKQFCAILPETCCSPAHVQMLRYLLTHDDDNLNDNNDNDSVMMMILTTTMKISKPFVDSQFGI